MGARSSRLGSRPSRTRVNSINGFNLYSLLCGGSASRAMDEMDDHPVEPQVDSTEGLDPAIIGVCKGREDLSSACCVGTRGSISTAENGISSRGNLGFHESTVEEGTGCSGTIIERENLSESKELVPLCQVRTDHSDGESSRDNRTTVSSSFVGQPSSDPVSVNVFANEGVVNGIANSVDNGVSQILPDTIHTRSSPPQGLDDFSSGMSSAENLTGEVVDVQNPESDSATSHVIGRESFEETPPSGLGFLMSNRERGHRDGSVLHVDVVTISTNILPISDIDSSNEEARRNSRRLFWDTFSRHSSRRHGDSPNTVFPASDNDEHGSRDRWLLDLTGDLFSDGVGNDSRHLGSRMHRLNERRRHSRSEFWERLRGGLDEISHWSNPCPLGLHPDGACACDVNPVTEESSTRANISRIVMLAEALFEVLDEIHRQPVSLSLSMVSLPAPESVVDSFPLKNHKKIELSGDGIDVEQCYICLAEYEEGDKIRVLPCQHEYHMACVDKWLKEIHGICPLCRGDVCEGVGESAASTESDHSPVH